MIGEIIIGAILLLNYGYVESGPNPLTIIGGNNASNETYKFFVSVAFGRDACGGSIISPTYVITAAHCVHAASLKPALTRTILVKVGIWSIVKGPACVATHASQLFEHPCYNNVTKVNDISLLLLQVTLEYGTTIGAISLPIVERMTYVNGTELKIIGFGERRRRGERGYTPMLKEGDLEIEADALCTDKYGIQFVSQICASYYDIELEKHDDGSPVLYQEMLIGIVSLTGENDKRKGYTVLLRIADYLEFIDQRIRPPQP